MPNPSSTVQKPPCRFRLSLRSLFVLVTVVRIGNVAMIHSISICVLFVASMVLGRGDHCAADSPAVRHNHPKVRQPSCAVDHPLKSTGPSRLVGEKVVNVYDDSLPPKGFSGRWITWSQQWKVSEYIYRNGVPYSGTGWLPSGKVYYRQEPPNERGEYRTTTYYYGETRVKMVTQLFKSRNQALHNRTEYRNGDVDEVDYDSQGRYHGEVVRISPDGSSEVRGAYEHGQLAYGRGIRDE